MNYLCFQYLFVFHPLKFINDREEVNFEKKKAKINSKFKNN